MELFDLVGFMIGLILGQFVLFVILLILNGGDE